MVDKIINLNHTIIGFSIFAIALFLPQKSPFSYYSDQFVTNPPSFYPLPPIKTQSQFKYQTFQKETDIPFTTQYQDDPQKEAGWEEITQEGQKGKIVETWQITYHQDKEFDRQLISSTTYPAINKIILRGSKVIWKTLSTADGEIKYWKKIRVYATHYDSRCKGCDEWTAIGMRAGKGVIAVDPKVIKLRSKVYIPGYGLAIAGDTGGAIKGNIIDLGFEDAKTAGWGARYTDIYLLD